MSQTKEHWEKVYTERKPDEVSWFQEVPTLSLALIEQAGIPKDAAILDMGAGASRLVDRLLAKGYSRVSVLDISGQALSYAKERLGATATKVRWIEADATEFTPPEIYDLWHDRAVFHFLTAEVDRERYLHSLRNGLRVGGTLILAAFAPDGPEKCSGLNVCRYDAASAQAVLGTEFELLQEADEAHRTPWDKEQRFKYLVFRRR